MSHQMLLQQIIGLTLVTLLLVGCGAPAATPAAATAEITPAAAATATSADGIWTTRADMPTARLALAASVVDGKIYAIGGRPDGALTTEYDPTTDTWTTKTRMPTARFCLATSVVDEKIYAIGGTPGPNRMFRTVEVYDPQTDTWTQKADMPRANCFFSANSTNCGIREI